MTADLHRLVKKNGADALNTIVCTHGKEIANKFVGPNVTFLEL